MSLDLLGSPSLVPPSIKFILRLTQDISPKEPPLEELSEIYGKQDGREPFGKSRR
jgi:hypothetical protein